jgi:glycosyltransferase involved in cell wall biosynthesis
MVVGERGYDPHMPEGRRVRLLWLSKETPDRYGQGGQRRQYFQIRALVDAGVDVTVATPAGEQNDGSVRGIATVLRLRRGRLRRTLAPDPLELACAGGFERMVLAHPESLDLLRDRHAELPLPWLADFHNVNSRWYAQHGDVARVRMWRDIEAEVLRCAAASLTCSAQETAALRAQRADASIAEAPNGIDPAEWPDAALGRRAPRTVAAFGSWWYPPNRDGLEWFLVDVWPLLCAEVPDARLVLAGTGTPPESATLPAGVEIAGRVADLAAFLGSAAVVAVPVLKGPGTPVKFAEALASGAAVAATADAAAGNPDAPAVISNDPGELARGIAALLRQPEQAAERGAAARRYALTRCPWPVTQRPLVAWVRHGTVEEVEAGP